MLIVLQITLPKQIWLAKRLSIVIKKWLDNLLTRLKAISLVIFIKPNDLKNKALKFSSLKDVDGNNSIFIISAFILSKYLLFKLLFIFDFIFLKW